MSGIGKKSPYNIDTLFKKNSKYFELIHINKKTVCVSIPCNGTACLILYNLDDCTEIAQLNRAKIEQCLFHPGWSEWLYWRASDVSAIRLTLEYKTSNSYYYHVSCRFKYSGAYRIVLVKWNYVKSNFVVVYDNNRVLNLRVPQKKFAIFVSNRIYISDKVNGTTICEFDGNIIYNDKKTYYSLMINIGGATYGIQCRNGCKKSKCMCYMKYLINIETDEIMLSNISDKFFSTIINHKEYYYESNNSGSRLIFYNKKQHDILIMEC